MDIDPEIEGLKSELEKKDSELRTLNSELLSLKEQMREITETRRAMLYMLEDLNESFAAIERAKNEWTATFDAISDPLFIHDKGMRLLRANIAYIEAAGMSFQDIEGRLYYEIFPKMDKPFRSCRTALDLQEEEEVYIPSIDKIFKVKFYPVKDAEDKYLYSVHILEDITEMKQTEKMLKEEMEITSHLLMISEATSDTTDMDRLMERVVHSVSMIMGSDACLSYLWDRDEKTFRPNQSYGLHSGLIPLFRTEPLGEKLPFVRQALESNEPLYFQPHSDIQDYGLEWIKEFPTILVLPLTGKTGDLGLLINLCKKQRTLTEKDRKVSSGITRGVSLALEEAQLYRDSIEKAMELANRIETIQVMSEIDRNILSTLHTDELLEIAIRNVSRVVPCERAAVALVDKEKGGFVFKAGFGISFMTKDALVPFEETSTTEVIKTGRPQYVANLKQVRNILPFEKKLLDDGFISHMRVPLTVKGEDIGVLNVGSKRPAAYSKDDLSNLERVAAQISVALENARLISDLEELFMGTVRTLSSAIDAKSQWTAGHSERVTNYAVLIGKEMGLSEKALKDLELGGLLHDVGKIGTYESILDKPGRLTDEELALMRQHPAKGAEIVSHIRQLKDVIPAIKYHHEFYDGTGYPERLKGEEIPFMARILSVADTFDAMKADRPYRTGRTTEFITGEFRKCSGTQFDPKVIGAFFKVIGSGEMERQ